MKKSRRTFLGTTIATGVLLSPLAQGVAGTTGVARAPSLAFGNDWSAIRGFNYQPSWGSGGYEIWSRFDAAKAATELALGKKYFPKINTIRIWLASDAFVGREELFKRDLESLVAAVDAIGCRTIPVLYNRWQGNPPFGAIYIDHFMPGNLSHQAFEKSVDDYLAATVGSYRQDRRILAWDLCNEPYFNQAAAGVKDDTPRIVDDAETLWLRSIHTKAKALSPSQPVTIATHGKHPLSKFDEFSDILTIHPYYMPPFISLHDFRSMLDEYVTFATRVGKPLVASECCVGSADDAVHVDLIKGTLSALKERGIGWIPHLLHHSLVADAHRPNFGPVGAGFMAFIEADGSLRAGHEIYNDF